MNVFSATMSFKGSHSTMEFKQEGLAGNTTVSEGNQV